MDFIIENIELLYAPHIKELLKIYCIIQYQENADLSDKSLKRELLWLYNNNELDQLILAEYLTSQSRENAIINGN